MKKSKSVIAIILATVLSIANVCPALAAEKAVVKSAAMAVSEVEESEDIAVSGDSGNNQVDVDQREGSSDDSEDEASGDSSALTDGYTSEEMQNDDSDHRQGDDSDKLLDDEEQNLQDSEAENLQDNTSEMPQNGETTNLQDDEATNLQDNEATILQDDEPANLQNSEATNLQDGGTEYEEMLEEIFSGKLKRYAVDASDEIISLPIRVQYGQTAARSMLDLMNEFRTGQDAWVWNADNTQKVPVSGLEELHYDLGLESIAMKRAAEIALSYSHTRPNGSDVYELLAGQDFGAGGENIAAGYESAAAVFDGWREENESYEGQGHRRNMLDSGFSYVGIGHVYWEGVHYWTQVFSDCSYWSDDEPHEAWTEDGEPIDLTLPNDREETAYINIASDRVDIQLETETEISVPVEAWADLPAVDVLVKVQNAWPDRYYQLPVDDFYTDAFSWGEEETDQYTIRREWSETEEDRIVYTICVNERGQYTLEASIWGKSIEVAIDADSFIESFGDLEVLDLVMRYDGTEKRARVKVLYEDTELTENVDYTVSYENNVEQGTAYVTVNGIGDYTGTLSGKFLIHEMDEIVHSGKYGEDTVSEIEGDPDLRFYTWWAIDRTGTLYVMGEGDMVQPRDIGASWGKSSNECDLYPWHEYSDQIRKVVVTDGLTSVGLAAFTDLPECTEAELAEGITILKGQTFAGCAKLEKVSLPQTLEEAWGFDFEKCVSLTSIQLPNALKNIAAGTFAGCSGLESIVIPNSVTYIGYSAFEKCCALEEVVIPDSVTYLGDDAFFECTGLTSVKISNNITEIYDDTFWGCTSLKTVTLPSKLETIELGAFFNCSSLKSINLPSTLKTIGALPSQNMSWQNIGNLPGVFEESGLTSIKIPDSVTYINDGTFRCCKNLATVTLSNKLTYLGQQAFCGCARLQSVSIPSTLTKIEKEAFWGCTGLTSVRLPANLDTIGEQAFYFCPSLQGVRVPASVTSIGELAFGENLELTLFGDSGSYVQTYAQENNIPFAVGIPICDTTITGIVSKVYTGKDITQNPTIEYDGVKLTLGKDYILSYINNRDAGTATMLISGKGAYGGETYRYFTIQPINAITAKNWVKTYSTKAQSWSLGVKIKSGTPTYKSNNKSVSVSKAGKVTVKAKFIGKATITITAPAIKNYAATSKKITITVLPTKTALLSVSNSASKKMTVKWKKNAVGSGYQIQYSTSSKFTSAKTVNISKNSIVSRIIGGLVKGKKYFVRIRTYKTVGSAKYYSGWSAAKYVTIKK